MLKQRSEVAQSDKWDVEAIFDSTEQAYTALEEVKKQEGSDKSWPELSEHKGQLEDKAKLKKVLDSYHAIERALVKIYTYAHLRFDENITDQKAKELFETIQLVIHQFQTAASWVIPEILHLDQALFEAIKQDPLFSEYTHFLRQLATIKPYTLSEKEEYILSLSSDATSSLAKAFGALDSADLIYEACKDSKGEKHPLSHGLYGLYMQSTDRTLRQAAFENLHAAYKQHEHTFSELLTGQVKTHWLNARARGYDSCLHAALNKNEVDVAVYNTLIETVKERASALHNYINHRKEKLGVSELFPYDLQVPLSSASTKKYTYEEAEQLVLESIKPLGEEYVAIATKGFKEQGWVDRYENQNKRSGAYSSGCFDSHPYILMNFNGSLRDVFTLAHELGHSMHSYYSKKAQNYVDASYSIFVAEVASTFNERLLLKTLLEKATTEEEKEHLLYYDLEGIRATLFRQTLFAEFEKTIHTWAEAGEPISSGKLKQHYLELNKQYYGSGLTLGDFIEFEGFRIPHFYYNFYVYQYATGISAAYALYNKVMEEGQSACEKYLTFLRSGSTKDPVTLLERAGVSLRSAEPVNVLIDHFETLVNHLSGEAVSKKT